MGSMDTKASMVGKEWAPRHGIFRWFMLKWSFESAREVFRGSRVAQTSFRCLRLRSYIYHMRQSDNRAQSYCFFTSKASIHLFSYFFYLTLLFSYFVAHFCFLEASPWGSLCHSSPWTTKTTITTATHKLLSSIIFF